MDANNPRQFCLKDLPKLKEVENTVSFKWTSEFCKHILKKRVHEESKYVSSGQARDAYENGKALLKNINRFDTGRILQILFLIFISYYCITFICGIFYM
ncbi:MAG: hypothetical protein MHPSP_004173, partial [Paramarteilia canceri]